MNKPAPRFLKSAPRRDARTGDGPAVATLEPRPAQRTAAPLLRAVGLKKSYFKAGLEIPVLRGVDIEVHEGELLGIIGQSGSGKSTLLHVLATLDSPDAGEVHFHEQRIDNLRRRRRDALRNQQFGMIFQFYHLLPELTCVENVLMPLMIGHGAFSYLRRKKAFVAQAEELLELVGMSHRRTHKPRELSGGEMQRTAIARALITRPQVLLADEPTGNLDRETGEGILHLLRSLNAEKCLTIVMVTHDLAIAQQADRLVRLSGGRVETVQE